MNLLAVVWDFNPTLIEIFGFEIRWYSLSWVAALMFGGWLFSYFCKREGKPEEVSDRAFMYIALGTIIGARLGHCLFYEPMEYLREPWRIITGIREGGLASHGAAIGIILGIWLSSRKSKVSVWWTADRLGIIAPLSGAMIRFGNLFNSEIIGNETTVPWGFKFMRLYPNMPEELVPVRHATQLYEALCYIATFALILWIYYRKDAGRRRPGLLFGIAMIGIFLTRFFIEFCKERQVAFEEGLPLDMGQMLSIPFIILGVYMIIRAFKRPEVTDVNAVVAYANKQYAKELKSKGKK